MVCRFRQVAGRWIFGVFPVLVWSFGTPNPASENTPRAAGGMSARSILDAAGVRGGLIVHVGCGDGTLTTGLRINDRYLVHGLDTDATAVRRARQYIQTLGLDGAVSVDRFDGKRLPYADNLVSLLVAEKLGNVPMREVMRVLSPRGVAYVKTGDRWTKTVKPWPAEIDEWTHFLHGPDNNAVAKDTVVGPPRHVQWVARPEHARQHDHLASLSAAVSAGGRLFCILDEGPVGDILLPARWTLVARDAFNGLILWKRPIRSWENHLRRFRSGPAELPRRLVAVGDRVYVTLGYNAPVSALDAATGKTVRVLDQTRGTEEILCDGGTLYLVLGDPAPIREQQMIGSRGPFVMPRRSPRRLAAVGADTGQTLWTKSGPDVAGIMPLTLAVGDEGLFFQTPTHITCLDRKTGAERWRRDHRIATDRASWSTPTLVVCGGVVLSADRVLDTTPPRPKRGRSSFLLE